MTEARGAVALGVQKAARSGCALESGLPRSADGVWPKGVERRTSLAGCCVGRGQWVMAGGRREATWKGCVWAKDGSGQRDAVPT